MKKIQPCSLKALINYIENKQVICFGAGIQGKRAAIYFKNWGIEDTLLVYVDNSVQKQNESVETTNRSIPIMALEKAVNIYHENIFLLVTCLNYKDIYKQLEGYSECNWEYIAMDEIADVELEKTDYEKVVIESEDEIIPRIIHYAWFGDSMPDAIKNNIEDWHRKCPEFEIIKWNNDNYNVTKNRYMKQAYEHKIWGFVPDYMRLDIVYNYGGIYLDTDVSIEQNLLGLLHQKCFASVDASLTMNLGSGFGAAPNCEIIKKLRDYYDTADFVRADGTVDNTSCNTHSLRVLEKYGYVVNNRFQNVEDMNIYPMNFQGVNQHTKKMVNGPHTYLKHYGNMSWMLQKSGIR